MSRRTFFRYFRGQGRARARAARRVRATRSRRRSSSVRPGDEKAHGPALRAAFDEVVRPQERHADHSRALQLMLREEPGGPGQRPGAAPPLGGGPHSPGGRTAPPPPRRARSRRPRGRAGRERARLPRGGPGGLGRRAPQPALHPPGPGDGGRPPRRERGLEREEVRLVVPAGQLPWRGGAPRPPRSRAREAAPRLPSTTWPRRWRAGQPPRSARPEWPFTQANRTRRPAIASSRATMISTLRTGLPSPLRQPRRFHPAIHLVTELMT